VNGYIKIMKIKKRFFNEVYFRPKKYLKKFLHIYFHELKKFGYYFCKLDIQKFYTRTTFANCTSFSRIIPSRKLRNTKIVFGKVV